jgi:hypothetical protein
MDITDLKLVTTNSYAVKLLRAKSYVVIISFFFKVFKDDSSKTTFSEDEMTRKLIEHLEYFTDNEIIDEETEREWLSLDEEQKAIKKLDKWSSQGYLIKYPDDSGNSYFELSSESEKVLLWIESLQKRSYVGTESRFVDILMKLKEIVENTSEDYEKRITELEKRKQEIEAEIRTIRINRSVNTFSDTQIKDRFYDVIKLSKELLSDFGEVEGNFQHIMHEIYDRHNNIQNRRGDIVFYALDALDELKEKDQGKSFYAFWKFLTEDKSQENFRSMIDAIYTLIEDKNIELTDHRFFSHLKHQLYHSGKKVIDANKKLSDKLSRIIAEKNSLQRKAAIELINQIKHEALARIQSPPSSGNFINIDTTPDLFLISSRVPSTKQESLSVRKQPKEMGGRNFDEADFTSLFNQFNIDRQKLHERVNIMLKGTGQVTLREIMESYPLTKGLTEIIAYMSIASQSDKHIISSDYPIKVPLNKDATRFIEIPQIIFNS